MGKNKSEWQFKHAWRNRLHSIMYKTDTPEGRGLDIIILCGIIASIITVMLESVESIRKEYYSLLNILEWAFTILFSIEYIARVISARHASNYVVSGWGIIDLLAASSKYISLFFVESQYGVIVRALRLLRVFRVFKLGRYIGASEELIRTIVSSRAKIIAFLGVIVAISMIMGTVMYLIEGEENGFTSIPIAIYWTVVTMTTVGYGEITPETPLGQFLSIALMLIGYGIIAIPTGIVSAQFVVQKKNFFIRKDKCPNCQAKRHKKNALYCYKCGVGLYNDNQKESNVD